MIRKTIIILFIILGEYFTAQTVGKSTSPDSTFIVTPSDYKNILNWSDLETVNNETYSIYYNFQPFGSFSDSLELATENIPEGVQSYTHYIKAPLIDYSQVYYYALAVRDSNGNLISFLQAPPVTNVAQGTPVIYNTGTPNFTADGDLMEWITLQPFRLSITKGTAFKTSDSQISGDADLYAEVYLAMDNDHLFAAFEIEDDVVVQHETDDVMRNDSPELFIGLYQIHRSGHENFMRGSEPDYHLLFLKTGVFNISDVKEVDTLLLPGTHYFWGEKFPTGYRIEAKISLADLAGKYDSLFIPRFGIRLPVDLQINDVDKSIREGVMYYSRDHNIEAGNPPKYWSYSWIYNLIVDDIKDNSMQLGSYNLAQNFPNPFNPVTTINYSIENGENVSIKVFDVLGREVRELVNEYKDKGNYSLIFDASGLASGVYIYHIRSGKFFSSGKMTLSK